jgi:hypothetical protein
MPHDPLTGDHAPVKSIHKSLEIVAPGVLNIPTDEYYIVRSDGFNWASVVFTGTLDECLGFVRDNME